MFSDDPFLNAAKSYRRPGCRRKRFKALFLSLLLLPGLVVADEIRVAVASNFAPALKQLATNFEIRDGRKIHVVTGSSGKLFAQISNGAPFDLFLSADRHRPMLLEQQGRARAGTRFTYALGRLALWSTDPERVDEEGRVLASDGFRRLAIANPRLAPYGLAAKEVLMRHDRWTRLQPKLVRGENIAQTFHFVNSGNAELGFVAMSQLITSQAARGSYWAVPANQHSPIEQQAVRLSDHPLALAFSDYLRSSEALAVIHRFGYATADEADKHP